jgi:ribosomal silencing factor RsfS
VFDVTRGSNPPEAENTDNWTINPLTDGEQIWVHVFSESSLEHYALHFQLDPAAP